MPELQAKTFSGFIQYLTTFPDPDSVAQAVVRGPLAQFGCKTTNLWVQSNYADLVCVGMHGLDDYDFQRYSRLSLSVASPLTQSFLNSETIVLPVSKVVEQFPTLRLDQDFWDDVLAKNGDGDIGQMPIFANGVPIGAVAFLCDRLNEWNLKSFAVLQGLAAALGLWMSHQQSNVLGNQFAAQHEGLSLTERQIQILTMVGEGKSNTAISARLGFSQSTVKQELQRIMRRLKVHSREEALQVATELQLLTPPPREMVSS